MRVDSIKIPFYHVGFATFLDALIKISVWIRGYVNIRFGLLHACSHRHRAAMDEVLILLDSSFKGGTVEAKLFFLVAFFPVLAGKRDL